MIEKIKHLLAQKNAVLVAHYYVDAELQELAETSEGFVGDSLEMARFGKNTDADIIIVAGVRFMGETAKILSPQKKVLVLDLQATCSLDEGCPEEEFKAFCQQHPEREVVVYANTSARIKALADWMVTSSSAVSVVNHLKNQGKKILWAPDKHLGSYVKNQTGADMILWDGSCVVHEKFKHSAILELKNTHPEAKVLVHPESPQEVIAIADVVGSTTELINAVKGSSATYIVATEQNIFYKMREANPEATLIVAPTMGTGGACVSCAVCEWMALNSIEKLLDVLDNENNEIILDTNTIQKAKKSINRLLEFT